MYRSNSLGFTIRVGIVCVVAYWHLDLTYLYIGQMFESLTGSVLAIVMGMAIYVADNTDPKASRSYGIVLAQVSENLFLI